MKRELRTIQFVAYEVKPDVLVQEVWMEPFSSPTALVIPRSIARRWSKSSDEAAESAPENMLCSGNPFVLFQQLFSSCSMRLVGSVESFERVRQLLRPGQDAHFFGETSSSSIDSTPIVHSSMRSVSKSISGSFFFILILYFFYFNFIFIFIFIFISFFKFIN